MNKKEVSAVRELIEKIDSIQRDITDIKIAQAVTGEKVSNIEETLKETAERDLHTRTSTLEAKMNYVVTGILGTIGTVLMTAWETIVSVAHRLFS